LRVFIPAVEKRSVVGRSRLKSGCRKGLILLSAEGIVKKTAAAVTTTATMIAIRRLCPEKDLLLFLCLVLRAAVLLRDFIEYSMIAQKNIKIKW